MAVRVGVIGAGAYAQRAHIPSLGNHRDVELRAVCRRNPTVSQRTPKHLASLTPKRATAT